MNNGYSDSPFMGGLFSKMLPERKTNWKIKSSGNGHHDTVAQWYAYKCGGASQFHKICFCYILLI